MANINNYNDFLYEFMRANALKKAKMGVQYPDYMAFMLRDQLAKEGKVPGQGQYNQETKRVEPKTNAQQFKQTIEQPKAAKVLENKLIKEGLKKGATSGKAGIKSRALSIAPIVGTLLEVPSAIKRWNDPNANALTRTYDALSVASPYLWAAGPAVAKPGAALGTFLFPMTSQRMLDNAGNEPVNPLALQEGSSLDPDSVSRYEKMLRQQQVAEADNTLAQANTQQQEMQNAIDWYSNYDNRMRDNTNNQLANMQTLNLRLSEPPTTGVNRPSNVSYPITNLSPINEPPTGANKNIQNNQSIPQGVNNNMNNQDANNLLNNIQFLSAYAKGVQQGNQLPNLGVTQDELNQYQEALKTYGNNISQARKDIDTYKKALQRDRNVDATVAMLGGLGNIAANLQPMQNTRMLVHGYGLIGDEAPSPVNYNDIISGIRNVPGQADMVAKNIALEQQQRELDNANAQRFAELLTNARVSNATGLPINVVQNMKPEDYLSYLKPTQDRQAQAQEQALQGVRELITGGQQQQSDLVRDLAKAQAAYEVERLSQLNQNQRAVLNAQVEREVNALDNATRLKAMQLSGYNAQQLEQLRQKDPNAYLRAMGNVLMSAAYYGGPVGSLGQQMLMNIFNDMGVNSNNQAANPQTSRNNFVQDFIRNTFK